MSAPSHNPDPGMPPRPGSLPRSMGQFFGFLWAGVRGKAPADPPASRRVRTQERTIETPEGPVTLRRTTIDEVLPPEPPR